MMASQSQHPLMRKQVPRETNHVSPSVISSSKINQGDLVAADSSSSSGISPTGTDDSITSPSLPLSIPTIKSTKYASLSDINCSSNAKTYSNKCDENDVAANAVTLAVTDEHYQSMDKDWVSTTNTITNAKKRDDDVDDKNQSQVLDDVSGSETKFSILSCIQPVTKSQWVDTLDEEGFTYCRGWGLPKGLGLRGGGENSLNAGTSGWGTPPAAAGAGWGGAAPGPPQGQWGAGNRPAGPAPNAPNPNPTGADFNNQNKPGSSNQPGVAAGGSNPVNAPPGATGVAGSSPAGSQPPAASVAGPSAAASGNTSWAQAAGKGLPQGPTPTQNSTTKQIEQLNSMREALFAQDGWGGQHVNQDTSWDAPGTPEPSKGDPSAGGAPMWKQNVNNGTDLWEANLRNGGQPPAQPQNKTPWGHTPTTNIGGTWGEEDENSEACNVWTGAPGGAGAPGGQAPWPGAQGGPWPEKKPEWGPGPGGPGAAAGGPANQWGDPRAPVPPMDPRDPRDPNNLPLNDMSLMRMRDPGLRGDPRGVSGRLNSSEQMWAAHQPPPTPKLPGLPPAAANQWSSGLPKDMGGMVNAPGKPSGWEEPSPPAQRRNIPNYDDGTSLWGQQQQPRLPQPSSAVAPNKNNLAQWDKLPGGPVANANNMGRGAMPCPTAMPTGARMPSIPSISAPGTAPTVKPDGGAGAGGPTSVWGGQGRNGGWDQEAAAWEDSKLTGNWPGESRLTPTSWQGQKPGGGGGKPSGWGEDSADGAGWGHPLQRPNVPKLTSDFIYSSKQFRVLYEMNYKKEDVENALRTTNMSIPDAMELLSSWNRHEEHPYDQSIMGRGGFNPVHPLGVPPGNGATNPSMGINKMNVMQNQVGLAAGQPRPNTAQPSAQQLKMLIHQIQMAVQAGYLNHQILNQPLAPPTLLLVNQLLQQIKLLQQLGQRHHSLSLGGQLKANPTLAANISLQMSKTKQNIQNFQNQITGHQANYVKQQQQQQAVQQLSQAGGDPGDLFKSSQSFADPLAQLASFGDLSMSDKTSMSSFQTQSQSRLTQWKLPSLDKESEGSEFSRAPGSAKLHSSNLTETWSTMNVRGTEGTWPDGSSSELTDKDSQWSTPQQSNSIADFIPEFEPGKPWKGTQMKTVEDDPSMTPGSVARSPLTMASIKDSDILSDSNKASPGPGAGPSPGQDNSVLTSLGLSTSPWTTLNSATSVYTSPLSKLSSSKSWGETAPTGQGADSWLAGKTARGPPPGLSSKLGQPQPHWGGTRGTWASSPSWGSPWLILRNLTPQIDGSTLKTLCMQHGPLQNFHLHLNVGTALAKYATREEASKMTGDNGGLADLTITRFSASLSLAFKHTIRWLEPLEAQQALNNCVLGNTTIFAESPGESEVATLLNQLGHTNSQPNQQPQTNWNIRTSQANPSKSNDTWATSAGSLPGYGGSGSLWQSTGSSSSLWGSEGDTHRSTPSGTSLNSFLPPDLLNGETM